MLSTITYRKRSERLASSDNSRRRDVMSLSARHQLLGGSSRTPDVQKLEWAIAHFKSDPNMVNTCEVALFEIVGDEHLHCNVTHRHETKSVSGWAGPGHVSDGFVHNRRFRDTPPEDIIRHIHDMVFAARV